MGERERLAWLTYIRQRWHSFECRNDALSLFNQPYRCVEWVACKLLSCEPEIGAYLDIGSVGH
jgi:hypothetical protein